MPNTEIRMPNLTPGKRYRMVISANTNVNGVVTAASTTSTPSLEFVVPPSPKLISTYTPTYSVVSVPWSTSTTTTNSYPDTRILAGSTRAAGTATVNITGWKRGTSIYPPYQFYVNSTTNLAVGQTFTVYGMSSPAGGDYYDRLLYTIVSISGSTVGATATVPYQWPSGFTTSWKNANGAPLLSLSTTSNTGTLSSPYPAIPAADYYVTPNPSTYTTTTVTTGTYYHIDVSVPSDIKNNLVNTETVFDLPVFFYIKNGAYYNFDDTAMSTTISSLSSKPTTITFTSRNNNVNSDYNTSTGIVSTRDYRFTVIRYVLQGTSWVGTWLQKDTTYDTVGASLNKLIYSQSAVKA